MPAQTLKQCVQRLQIVGFTSLIILLGSLLPVRADDVPEQHLSLKNHTFTPSEIDVPIHQKVKLIVKNEDDTAAEFESYELNREKVVPAQSEVAVFIDALDAGRYPFFDDFHRDTTKGVVVAK